MAATLNSAGIVYSDGTLAYSTAAGGVGSYSLMYVGNGGSEIYYGPGTGLPGSWLYYSTAAPSSGGTAGGSWRVMGTVVGGNTGSALGVTVFCRYA